MQLERYILRQCAPYYVLGRTGLRAAEAGRALRRILRIMGYNYRYIATSATQRVGVAHE